MYDTQQMQNSSATDYMLVHKASLETFSDYAEYVL